MIINNNKISLEEAINFSDYEKLLLIRRDNGLLLSDFQISVLIKSGIDYKKYSNFKELLFEIESCLDDYYDDELDLISSQISEYLYYYNTNK